MSDIKVFTILVPTQYEDTKKYVSTKHHKEWDKFVLKTTNNGLTVLPKTVKGMWVNNGKTFTDRCIPVIIACTEAQIDQIAQFTKTHYRQLSIMYFKISDDVKFV